MNSFLRFNSSKFLFFFIVFFAAFLLSCGLPYRAYGNNPRRDFVRDVITRIVELSRDHPIAHLGKWEGCLNEAIRVVREEGRYAAVPDDLVQTIRELLISPGSAKTYVTLEEGLAKKLPPDWEDILKLYVTDRRSSASASASVSASASGALEVARPKLSPKLVKSRHEMLMAYYRDEIPKEAYGLLISEIPPELVFLRSHFQRVETVFRGEEEIALNFIGSTLSKLDDVILKFQMSEEKFGVDILDFPHFMEQLKELRRKIWNYGKIMQEPALARGYHPNPNLDGFSFDISMAKMRYGNIEAKKRVLSLWFADLQHGFKGHGFKGHDFKDVFQRSSVLSEILSQPDNEFRRYALELFYKNFPGFLRMPELRMALDGLWGETCRYFPGEGGFQEAVETMIFLLLNPHLQEGISSLLASRGVVSLAEKRIALRALASLELESAFGILSRSYFTDFRNDLLNDPLLFEAFIEALIVSVRRYPDHQKAAAIKFLKSIIQSETDTAIRKRAIRTVGEMFTEGSFLYQLLLNEKDREIQAELILALSEVSYGNTERALRAMTTERVLQFRSHEDPNICVAAALFLRRHGDDEAKGIGNEILGHVMTEAELSSKLTDRFRRLILSIIPENAKIPSMFKKAIAYFVRVEPDDLSVDALLMLCRLDDPAAAKNAALILLKTRDHNISPSNKRRIIHALLKWFPEDTEILKETLTKIIDFYRDPRYGFDILDELSAHASPRALERLSKLSEDPAIPAILNELYWIRSQNVANPRLVRFVDELATEIQNSLSNQLPPPPF